MRVPAAELYRLGVVDRVLPTAELLPAAVELASTIAAKSPAALRVIRPALRAVENLPLEDGFQLEQDYTTRLSASPEAARAREAFLAARGNSHQTDRN
ncbi:MAG: enoyl-CoA hydratase-related protein [Galbitalea sp.]